MCRLFGLIANKEVDIRFSMLEAPENFKKLGKHNPHGWGMGWYEDGEPKIEKYGESAFCSKRFEELAKEVKSRIIIAHVRIASSGASKCNKNAHPFRFRNFIFAHNGTIDKSRICRLLRPPYNKDFTSEPIDSEIYFRYIVQCMEEEGEIKGIKKAVQKVIENADGANFILSDGQKLYAFRYEKSLYCLKRDPEEPLQASSQETFALLEAKKLASEKAVLVASEKLTDEKWEEITNGELIIVSPDLAICKKKVV